MAHAEVGNHKTITGSDFIAGCILYSNVVSSEYRVQLRSSICAYDLHSATLILSPDHDAGRVHRNQTLINKRSACICGHRLITMQCAAGKTSGPGTHVDATWHEPHTQTPLSLLILVIRALCIFSSKSPVKMSYYSFKWNITDLIQYSGQKCCWSRPLRWLQWSVWPERKIGSVSRPVRQLEPAA